MIAVTTERLIFPKHLPEAGTVLVGDISVPGAVSDEVQGLPRVWLVPLAGTVKLPWQARLPDELALAQGDRVLLRGGGDAAGA